MTIVYLANELKHARDFGLKVVRSELVATMGSGLAVTRTPSVDPRAYGRTALPRPHPAWPLSLGSAVSDRWLVPSAFITKI